jgi:hypothetical protein
MRLGRISIRLIAVLAMLAILITPMSAFAETVPPPPQIKVTPQAGSTEVIFLVTGVGFVAPAVTGTLYLQVVSQSTGVPLEFGDPAEAVLEVFDDGLIASAVGFGRAIPDGAYQARVASALTGGTVYATYDMRLDSTLPVVPAISVTPSSGPKGDPDGEGTLFMLAGTMLTPNEIYLLLFVSTDGYTVVAFDDPYVQASEEGFLLELVSFAENLAVGDYIAGLVAVNQQTGEPLEPIEVVATANFTITAPAAPPVTVKPEIKVTPQAGPNEVLFLVTGVGFGAPNVSGRLYLQVQSRSTEQYLEFENPVVSPTREGLIASSVSFDAALPNGTYIAKIASAPTGGTVYASYEMRVDSSLPVTPAISITPSFGPSGDPSAGGTYFILAGTSLTPNASYYLEVASADGSTVVVFDPPTVQADEDGIVLQVLTFEDTLPNGAYVARLRNSETGPIVAQANFGIGTTAPASPGPSAPPSNIPSPPPTGNGGFLPGLPNTGDGGALTAASDSSDLGLLAGGLAIVSLAAVGGALRRRRAA